MTTVESYLEEVNDYLIDHPQVDTFRIITERIQVGSTYIRVRLTLVNGSFLHFTEYREADVNGELQLITYSYQWMNSENVLLTRWDNAEHYPKLPNFPHHLHNGDEKNVLPGEPMNLFKVLDIIADELKKSSRGPR